MNYQIDFNQWVIQKHVLIATIKNTGLNKKIVEKCKKMILNRAWRVEHPFTGQNTQQIQHIQLNPSIPCETPKFTILSYWETLTRFQRLTQHWSWHGMHECIWVLHTLVFKFWMWVLPAASTCRKLSSFCAENILS